MAAQKQFYAQSKQYKAYQRLLKREGYTTQPAQHNDAQDDDNDEPQPQPQQQQQKKRKREEQRQDDERAGEEDRKEAEVDADENVRTSQEAGTDGEVKDGEEAELQWAGQRKKKKKKAGPVVKSKEQIRQEIEERQHKIAESRHVRAEKFKRHAQRTSRGQPVSPILTASSATQAATTLLSPCMLTARRG